MDVRDLALLLGPGDHDLSGTTLIISDGAGQEIEVKLEEGNLKVERGGFVRCEDEDEEE